MLINHLQVAVRAVELAEVSTANPDERKELERIWLELRRLMAKRGVFIGSDVMTDHNQNQSTP